MRRTSSRGKTSQRKSKDVIKVSFGFEFQKSEASDDLDSDTNEVANPPVKRESAPRPTAAAEIFKPRTPNSGLGDGLGGLLTRSCLSKVGGNVMDSRPSRYFPKSKSRSAPKADFIAPQAAQAVLPTPAVQQGSLESLTEQGFPPGILLGLLLDDQSAAPDDEVQQVKCHRWTFAGATDIASRSRGFCFFVRCLLDMQRNVQLDNEGDALDPKLARACRSFVTGKCRDSLMGDMYHLLTHFLSNAIVFGEWERFLVTVFDDPRAETEDFLVPHLDEVWRRFCRLWQTLQHIFEELNAKFVPLHRLPTVENLVKEHVRRRCFTSDSIARNEYFAAEQVSNATLKEVKRTFGFVS